MHTGNHLLGLLDAEVGAALAPHLNRVQLTLGDVLTEPGSQVEAAYFPVTGLVSIVTDMEDGAATESLAISSQGAVGLTCALGTGTSQTRAVVQAGGYALKVEAKRLRALAGQHPSILWLAVRYAQSENAQLHQAAACNALHATEQRLSRWLLTCEDLLGSDTIPMTQEYVATMLGVHRTTVTAVASRMQSAGLITYTRGRIKVRDRAGLAALSCECYGVNLGFMAIVDWAPAAAAGAPPVKLEAVARLPA